MIFDYIIIYIKWPSRISFEHSTKKYYNNEEYMTCDAYTPE